jgi:DNA-binding transcriptional regulator YbjK
VGSATTRTRQPRGAARQQTILRASLQVVAERGVSATTHRAVAEKADVPLGTVTYYFPTVDDLLEGALRRFVVEETTRMRAAAKALEGASASPDEIAEAMIAELAVQQPDAAVPQFELYLEATRRPALRSAARECLRAYADVAEAALRAAGASRAREGAEFFVALVDGLGLHQMASPRDDHLLRLRRGLRELFIAYALSPDERAAWEVRLAGESLP